MSHKIEPKYIVYLTNRYRSSSFLNLNIVLWQTKQIWEKTCFISHPKKLTTNRITRIINNSIRGNIPIPLKKVHWIWCDSKEAITELYTSTTNENIKRNLEKLEGTKFSFIYFIYAT